MANQSMSIERIALFLLHGTKLPVEETKKMTNCAVSVSEDDGARSCRKLGCRERRECDRHCMVCGNNTMIISILNRHLYHT